MYTLREGLPELPARMQSLPVNEKGYPVPWFVHWINGKPDFRLVDAMKFPQAVSKKVCWICGQALGRFVTFVAGPMCAISRTSAEPPSHIECARFAVRACPFLTLPKAKRRDSGLPDDITAPGGIMLEHNPGVCMLWTTREYSVFRVGRGDRGRDALIEMGRPVSVEWYAQGRDATRAEIYAAINIGLPILQEMARRDGPGSEHLLKSQVDLMRTLIPSERHASESSARNRGAGASD